MCVADQPERCLSVRLQFPNLFGVAQFYPIGGEVVRRLGFTSRFRHARVR